VIVAPRRRPLAENGGESTKLYAGWRCGAQKCLPAQVLQANRHVENAGASPWLSKRIHTAAGTGSAGVFEKDKGNTAYGFSKYDAWTVDREQEMVLFRRGGGHSMESKDEDYWTFIEGKGYYFCDTTLLSKAEVSSEEIAITRSIGFQTGEKLNDPDAETVGCIKEALQEYSRRYLFDLGACAAEDGEAKRAKNECGLVAATSPGWSPGRRR
jgi:hypothetical protein